MDRERERLEGERLRLSDAFATPVSKRRYNKRLFSVIAPRYDLITTVLSYGQDRLWKERVVELAAAGPGDRVLDLACGTADIGLRLAARGAAVVGLDLTDSMLRLARAKDIAGRLRLVVGDMTMLPIPTGSMDVVTVGYGLRNVPSLDDALSEILRVLRPRGRFVSLDFDKPGHPLAREIYLGYLTLVGSALGWVLHGEAETYRYIAASLRRYPGGQAVAERMERMGFDDVHREPLLGGLMALHIATKGHESVPRTTWS
jgi:demethylmenaquinone methyltransferase/2-methoxy-6-polyprenyl-1,4-benzoquinol methylase